MPKFVVQDGHGELSEHIIPEGVTRIGRSSDCGLVLTSRGVSRQHARASRAGTQVTIEDLGSHNGTFLNSHPLSEPAAVKHLDVIQVGDTVLVYEEFDSETASQADTAEAKTFDLSFLHRTMHDICANIARVVRGKDEVIRRVVMGLMSDGHVLVEDVPGVGKTMLAQALAKSVRGEYKRVQFTPDMLPSDVTGVNMYDESSGRFVFVPGPVFANVVLADEINRGTPRTQSSLLECMSEAVVTVDGRPHVLPKPFFVIATQNPADFHGTYPLPEAQLDRFLMRLRMGYPSGDVEHEILTSQVLRHPINDISYVVGSGDIFQCLALVRSVHVSERVKDYIVAIVESTRKHPALTYGCSPRGSLAMMRVSQSLAAMEDRDYVLPRDVRDVAPFVLGHRLPLRLQARAQWEDTGEVVESILESLPLDKWEED